MSDLQRGWFREPADPRPGDPAAGAPGVTGHWPAQSPARAVPRPGRWRPRPRAVIKIVAAVVVLVLASGAGLYLYLDSKLTRASALVGSAPSAGQNWLITGATGTLTAGQQIQLHTGHDTDTLSDTIMLLHVPANGGPPVLVSIPRDSYVPIPGNGQNKINAAYAFGGPVLLVRTVQDVTGLHIDHYLGIGFTGLVSVVNAIGGVRICLPGPMADPAAGLNLKAGCQTLNGTQALSYTRTRAFALGDLQRVQDQRVLMKAILSKVTSAGTLVNPFATIPAATGSADSITGDPGTHLYELIGSVVLWNRPEALQLFGDLAKDQPVPKSLLTGSAAKPTV